MHTYRLVDDFVDAEAEQALLASLVSVPTLYGELLDLLTSEIFPTQTDIWQLLALALEGPGVAKDEILAKYFYESNYNWF